jgi:hypothetical protein
MNFASAPGDESPMKWTASGEKHQGIFQAQGEKGTGVQGCQKVFARTADVSSLIGK